MKFRFWQKVLPDVDPTRIQELQNKVLDAEMLEAWKKTPSYRWFAEKCRELQEDFIEKNNAQAANGILQLTKLLERTIEAKSQALDEFTELQEEQRLASQSPAEPDTAPETRRSPQIT